MTSRTPHDCDSNYHQFDGLPIRCEAERERERERESEREREYVCVREIRAPHQLLGLSKNATLDDLAPDFVNQCRGNALIH
jgi:hypothetical protein